MCPCFSEHKSYLQQLYQKGFFIQIWGDEQYWCTKEATEREIFLKNSEYISKPIFPIITKLLENLSQQTIQQMEAFKTDVK